MRRSGGFAIVGLFFSLVHAQEPDPGWLEKARSGIERAEYRFSHRPDGALSAPNRAQDFRTTVVSDRLEVAPRTEGGTSWRLTLRTAAWGRGESLEPLETGLARADEGRLTLSRRPLTEIWVNDDRGLEQLYDIPAPPPGDRDAGLLRIVMEIAGDVLASADAEGSSVTFRNGRGEAVARLHHLVVLDAGGREVPARFRVAPGTIALEIDDRSAVYPLHVDPLLSSPSWTAEGNQASAFYGLRVAPAGDVNGDGFSDFLVAAYSYDNGQSNEGRVFLYLGSAGALSTTAARTFESNQADARFGWSIATAGDLNEDGFDDFAVGAQTYDNGEADEGAVFVYTGAATAAGIALAEILESNQADARLGWSLAYAGDVDGDGDSELVAGAPQWNGPLSNEGAIFVFHGDPTTVIATTAPWTAEGNQAEAFFGFSVAGGVDVNADGFSDVFAGAPGWDSSTLTNAGTFREYWGSATGLPASQSGSSEGPGGSFGHALAAVGDTNGDGYADVVVSSPFHANSFAGEGRIAVFRGGTQGLNVAASHLRYGGAAGAQLGYSVGAAGDVNGDGFADIVAGANSLDPGGVDNAGEVRVWHGSATGIATAPDWVFTGTLANSGIGEAAFTAGDVNGDGYSDLLVGEGGYDETGQTDEGRARLFLGSGNGLVTTAATLQGDVSATEDFGTSVAFAGDVNGDGFTDVIVGDPQYGPADQGAVFIYHGTAAGPSTIPTTTIEGEQFHSGYGDAVAGAGDVNGDGYDDVIVGAFAFDIEPDDPFAGKVYVYHGSSAGVTSTVRYSDTGLINVRLGDEVAGVGDVNGDGFADVAYSGGAGDGTEVHYGSATGVKTLPVEFLDGEDVEAAGDVNGDGLSDVITQWDSGSAFAQVFFGGTPEMDSGADWVKSASFESAAHAAGDVNGDGYDDIVHHFFGQTTAGNNLHLGGPSGPAATGTPLAFNTAIARAAGDVNGDGFSDLLVSEGGTLTARLGSASGYAATAAWSVAAANPAGSFSGLGDVNGDGFGDVLSGNVSGFGGGSASVYLGGGGDGLDFIPHHFEGDNSGPAAFLGTSGSSDRFRIVSRGRTARGRAWVAMDHQVAPVGTLLSAGTHVNGGFFDTGATDSSGAGVNFNRLVSGLAPETPYKWRMRFRTTDPIFRSTRWIAMPGNGPEIFDIRTSCVTSTWYRDVDGDGFGASAVSQVACAQPAGYVLPSGDCNDGNASVHPGQTEICDGVDNNCAGGIDEFPAPGALAGVSALANAGNIASFRWGPLAGADRYDVVRGNLSTLRSSGGDFKVATTSCAGNDVTTTSFTEADAGTGTAQWYLVRGVACATAGSYDTGAPGQAGSRDLEIAASGSACP